MITALHECLGVLEADAAEVRDVKDLRRLLRAPWVIYASCTKPTISEPGHFYLLCLHWGTGWRKGLQQCQN